MIKEKDEELAKKEVAEKAEEEKKKNSRECKITKIAYNICGLNYTEQSAQKIIDHNVMLGIMGYEYKQGTNDLIAFMYLHRQLTEEIKEYKKKSGKDFKISKCKDFYPDDESHAIYKEGFKACGEKYFPE